MMLSKYAWVDLETSGLSPTDCHICEIACVITDPLTLTEEAHFSRVVDGRTGYWEHQALEMHQKTGLYTAMAKGCTVEKMSVDFVSFLNSHMLMNKDGQPIPYHLAGSAVWFDRQFLTKMWGETYYRTIFSHRPVDVSTVKLEIRALCGEEVANEYNNQPERLMETQHRALDDIRHSIGQLRDFRKKGLVGKPLP